MPMASALQLLSNLSSPVSILKGGTDLQTRPRINIIEGSNVTIVATDDSVNYKTDITINSAGGGSGGTVTSVDGSGGTTGLTVTGGPITTTGTLTLGGTLGVANGGTGKTTFSTAGYVKANGTTALTSVSSIPGTDITGDISGTASNVTGIVAIVNGGTGSNSASTARTALGLAIGTDVLAPNGSAASLTGFPTLNQSTTGTASNVTGTVAIANGGTGQTTRQNALNALGGAVTNGYYLRGDGTNLSLSALSATDFSTGILDVAYGGTGTTSYTAGYVKASGTAAFTTVSTVSGSDVSGNIAGNAANVTGIVAIAHGGTGASSSAGAISNLGLGTLATQNGTFSGTHSGNSSGTNTGDQTSVSGSSGSCTGNAATATALATARAINGTNFDGTAAISISATATGTGAVARTINNRASDVFNVKDYGAVGNGSADDYDKINLAIAAMNAAGGGCIYFPAGNYIVTAGALTTISQKCMVYGDGIDVTKITCSARDGLRADYSSLSDHATFTVRDISLITSSNSSNTALYYRGVNNTTLGETFLFNRVYMSGGWTNGIKVDNTAGLNTQGAGISDCRVIGNPSSITQTDKAISISNASNVRITGCTIWWVNYGIYLTGTYEGTTIVDCLVVPCNYGVFSTGGATNANTWVSRTHIAPRTYGVYLGSGGNVNQNFVDSCYILGNDPAAIAIKLTGEDNIISNTLVMYSGGRFTGGIHIDGFGNTVVNCQIRNVTGAALTLLTGSSKCRVDGIGFNDITGAAAISDLGTNNAIHSCFGLGSNTDNSWNTNPY